MKPKRLSIDRVSRVVALLTVLLVVELAGCGDGDEDAVDVGETPSDSLENMVSEMEALLRQAIVEIGLDPNASRRDLVENSCIGPGGMGKNLRFYFDEPSHDRGVAYLDSLEAYWGRTDGVEINDPLQDDGSVASLLAVSGEFGLEAWWFPASRELAIGGSTPCV